MFIFLFSVVLVVMFLFVIVVYFSKEQFLNKHVYGFYPFHLGSGEEGNAYLMYPAVKIRS